MGPNSWCWNFWWKGGAHKTCSVTQVLSRYPTGCLSSLMRNPGLYNLGGKSCIDLLWNRDLGSAFLRSWACSVCEFENLTSKNNDDSNITKSTLNIKVKWEDVYFQKAPWLSTFKKEKLLRWITESRKTQIFGCFKIRQHVFLLCTPLVMRHKDAATTGIPQALLSSNVLFTDYFWPLGVT